LHHAAALAGPDGVLAYMTCSLLDTENAASVRRFLSADTGWRLSSERTLTPLDGGDGFFVAILARC